MLFFRTFSPKVFLTRSLALLLAGGILSGTSLSARASSLEDQFEAQRYITVDTNQIPDWPEGPVVTAEAAILMEAETGTVLYGKNIHKKEYPASTTKILTCLIAAENCEPDEMVYMSHSAVYDTPRGSNHIALDEGESITVEDALNAILIRSANEVSFAIGEHISGTTWQDFGPIMTQRAKELGCLNSNFINPNGLPDENHYTTAYDLATIARSFFADEMLAKISRTTKLEIMPSATQPDHIIEYTKNRLLPGQKYAYEYLVGSKTGYTDDARNCLVSCAEKDGLKLICVVLRDSSNAHYQDTIALFDYGFANFTKVNVAANETKYNIDSTGLFYGDNDIFGNSGSLLSLNADDFLVLPVNASFADTEAEITYETKDSSQAALINYTFNGAPVGSASVDFVSDAGNTYAFDVPNSSSASASSDSESSSGSVWQSQPGSASDPGNHSSGIFINIVKVILIALGVILAISVILLVLLYLRRNPGRRARRRAIRHRAARRRTARPTGIQTLRPGKKSGFSLSIYLERRRKYKNRKASMQRQVQAERTNKPSVYSLRDLDER